MITLTDSEHKFLVYYRDLLMKIWETVKPDEESEYDSNNLYSYVKEGVAAKKRLAEGSRAIEKFVAERTEEALVEFDVTMAAVNAAVLAEKERCAMIVDTAFDHLSPLAFWERYNADGKMVTRLNPQKSARAIADKIRSTK